ncbi:MAG: Mur ligase family protein [Sphingomonas sp.]
MRRSTASAPISRAAAPGAIFVALKGGATDGHRFLGDALLGGASAALVATGAQVPEGLPAIAVESPLAALQELARWHRREAIGQVLAITGSNGKTVVKNALETLLARRGVFASPGSFNSQLGLPVSVLSTDRRVDLAILEAGVSERGEMARLERIAAPDFGILTNIGKAHFASFGSREAIAAEKMALFANLPAEGWLLVPAHEPLIEPLLAGLKCRVHRLGAVRLTPGPHVTDGQVLEIAESEDESFTINVRTRSPEIVEDLHFAITAARLLGVPLREIAAALDGYVPGQTRMEMLSSSEGIRIINDAHSADPLSVLAAIRTAALSTPPEGRLFLVFGGMREQGSLSHEEHRQVGAYAAEYWLQRARAGRAGHSAAHRRGLSRAQARRQGDRSRRYRRARAQPAPAAPARRHRAVQGTARAGPVERGAASLGIDRAARIMGRSGRHRGHIAKFRRHCGSGVEVMAVLKALAYGTDLVQLARWMPQLGVSHIGVSSTNEGIAARLAGASQEIYVFLPDRADIDALYQYRLIPVLYSSSVVESFLAHTQGREGVLPVHLKVDTGMHRLASSPARRRRWHGGSMHRPTPARRAGGRISPPPRPGERRYHARADRALRRSHRRGPRRGVREPAHPCRQFGRGDPLSGSALQHGPRRHRALRHPFGAGGAGSAGARARGGAHQPCRQHARILARRAIRLQRHLYRRPAACAWAWCRSAMTDGMPRSISGKGHVLVGGRAAPILGAISMDQMLIDVTDIGPVEDGAQVLIYGAHGGHEIRPEEVATRAGTIAHELLVRIGRKVQRIYIEP